MLITLMKEYDEKGIQKGQRIRKTTERVKKRGDGGNCGVVKPDLESVDAAVEQACSTCRDYPD
jgi:hypothetical protein